MKKICIFLVFILMLTAVTVYSEDTKASDSTVSKVSVTYNGKTLTCDVDPYIENSRTLIPVRMAEQLGYDVEWDDKDRTVTLTKEKKEIFLKIGSADAKVNGKTVKLDVPAKITKSRTFVPVRFVAENFDYYVDWNADTRTVVITDDKPIKITEILTEKTPSVFNVKILSSGVINDVKPMVLQEPLRYIYDLQNVLLTMPNNSMEVNSDIVKSVRYSQFSKAPNVVRVVVELNRDSDVTAGYVDGAYTISVLDGEVPTITSLKAVENNEDTAEIRMKTDMVLNYKTYTLSKPNRFVLEIPDSDIAANDIKGEGIVESAKITRKGGTTLLTLYFSTESTVSCKVTQKGNEYTISVEKEGEQKDNGEFLIVIDPGHGGDEPGSLGMVDDEIVLYEKDVNLDIGNRVYQKLKKKGYNVISTRTADVSVSLTKRAEIANNSKADLFVSIHNNSFTDNVAKGTLTMYAYDTPKEGMKFSGKEVAAIIQPYLAEATKSQDRGLMENSKIYVVYKTNMPAVLCECLFMSNPEDLKKLMDEEYVEAIAEGITKGIQEAVKTMTK